ncbi:MAG: riboflavin synthase [Nitrospirae bacterium]|nr:riboflavin synthase [Nitrospirota bacterium]
MFTGLIEVLGTITSIRNTGVGIKLCIIPDYKVELQTGESISVNGVCLTVSELPGLAPRSGAGKTQTPELFFDVSPETLKNTNLGELKVNDKVNLERALRPTDRLGGHIVTGHVDGVGTIKYKRQEGEYTFYTFDAPGKVLKYIVPKGSITVDGISLTVIDVSDKFFKVAIIPHTFSATTFGFKGVGDKVNLEADILGKYVEKFLSNRDNNTGLMEKLREGGFTT